MGLLGRTSQLCWCQINECLPQLCWIKPPSFGIHLTGELFRIKAPTKKLSENIKLQSRRRPESNHTTPSSKGAWHLVRSSSRVFIFLRCIIIIRKLKPHHNHHFIIQSGAGLGWPSLVPAVKFLQLIKLYRTTVKLIGVPVWETSN